MQRRRRKPRVVWLPQSTVGQTDFATTQISTWHSTSIVAGNTIGDVAGVEVPLVNDFGIPNIENPATSLADIESSGYRLRRIVGNLYILAAGQTEGNQNVYGVTAGIIVRRSTQGTGGSQAATVGFDQIRPDCVHNQLDPWVWRRTWVLQDQQQVSTFEEVLGGADDIIQTGNSLNTSMLPGANFGWQYPGPTQGPNVDQKTARIIGQEERLFLDVSVTTFVVQEAVATHSLALFWDFRVLGSMRSMAGNRRNAVR